MFTDATDDNDEVALSDLLRLFSTLTKLCAKGIRFGTDYKRYLDRDHTTKASFKTIDVIRVLIEAAQIRTEEFIDLRYSEEHTKDFELTNAERVAYMTDKSKRFFNHFRDTVSMYLPPSESIDNTIGQMIKRTESKLAHF